MRPYYVLIGLFIAFIVYVWAQSQLFKHEFERKQNIENRITNLENKGDTE